MTLKSSRFKFGHKLTHFCFQLASYDIVSNLTGRNISDYLIKTTKDFKKRRYGGFEFGVGNPLADLNITLLQGPML